MPTQSVIEHYRRCAQVRLRESVRRFRSEIPSEIVRSQRGGVRNPLLIHGFFSTDGVVYCFEQSAIYARA
jgi:hypothetical protein